MAGKARLAGSRSQSLAANHFFKIYRRGRRERRAREKREGNGLKVESLLV